jgi:hypothetical protein
MDNQRDSKVDPEYPKRRNYFRQTLVQMGCSRWRQAQIQKYLLRAHKTPLRLLRRKLTLLIEDFLTFGSKKPPRRVFLMTLLDFKNGL